MDKLAPSFDRFACIDRDMAFAAPREALKTFVALADTFGKLVRKGYFDGDVLALEQKLWAVAEQYDLDVEDEIGKAIAPRTAAAIEADRLAELRRRQEMAEILERISAPIDEPKPKCVAAPPSYRPAQSTIDAFWYVVSLKDQAKLKDWLARHPQETPFLLKLLETK
jgi:hypothetical protein